MEMEWKEIKEINQQCVLEWTWAFSKTKSFKLHPKIIQRSAKLSKEQSYVVKRNFDVGFNELLQFLEVQTVCKVNTCHVNELVIEKESILL